MTQLVVDASAIAGLVLLDEDWDFAAEVARETRRQGAIVPSLWWYELRNILVVKERQRRLTVAQSSAFLRDVGELPIEIDPHPPTDSVLDLARLYSLSVYDAAYVELALRLQTAIATLDAAMLNAAERLGVEVFSEGAVRG